MLSHPFDVHSMDVAFAAALDWHLAPFRRTHREHRSIPVRLVEAESSSTGEQDFSYLRGNDVVYTGPLPAVLGWVVWDLHSFVGRETRDYLLLHAGAVARGGGALVIPAKQSTGKSSLVLALLHNGFDYLSDEFGALDPITRRAYPMPKHISLSNPALHYFPGVAERLEDTEHSLDGMPGRFIRPGDVGARVGGAAPVRWLVFPSPDRQGPPRLTPMTKAEAVEAMSSSCFNLFRYKERGVVLLSRIAAGAETYALSGGTPLERAELLAGELA